MFKSLLLSLAVAISGSLFVPAQALVPLPDANGEYRRDANGNIIVQDQNFRDFKAVRTGGSFKVAPDVVKILGYDPSRSWSAGDRPEDIIHYGDIIDYGLATYSLAELNPGQDTGSLPLSSLRILTGQTLSELVTSIPEVGETKIKNIAPLGDNLPEEIHNKTLNRLLETNIRQLKSELEAGIRQDASFLAEQEIDRLQNKITEGYGEGVELIAQNLNDRYLEVELNLVSATNAAKIKTVTQLAQATQRLKRRISQNIKNSSSANQAGSQIEQAYTLYRQETKQIIANNTQQYQKEILQQLTDQLGQKEALALDLTANFSNLNQVFNDFADETIGNAKTKITAQVTNNLNKIGKLSRRIPTEIGEIKLRNYDLSKYEVDDIPGAAKTPINKYKKYQESAISDVPGAADLDFDQYPFMPQFGTGIARVDWVFSNAEKYTNRTISGSMKDTFNLAHCRERQSIKGKGCAHIELIDEVIALNAGKQWVSGDSQETRGGKNALRGDGKEPTGRLPAYKSPFKMVLRNHDEKTDTVEMFLALQVCVVDPFGQEHCTPHDVFEIPLTTFKPGDLIFLGVTI